MNALPPIPAAVILTLLLGSGLLILATTLAVQRRGSAGSFAWMVVAGLSSCLLLLAAALQFREGDALRVAVVQLLMVTLAALLGALCGRAPETPPAPSAVGLSAAGRGLSWLTLLGLPPTLGFHAKLMLYHALLATGWGGLVVLTMAASAAGLAPALWALRSPPPAPVRGLSAALVVTLMALVLLLGLYPQPVLVLAGALQRAVASPQ